MPEIKVLFVCMGNICRSPLAEGVFSKLVEDEGLSDAVSADSAGTGAWHLGHPPDTRARSSAAKRGMDIGSIRSRLITPEDLDVFDYVLTMDEYNYGEVKRLGRGNAEIRRFMEFHTDSGVTEVSDPYYGDGDGFERALDLIEDASAGLLGDIRERHLSRRD